MSDFINTSDVIGSDILLRKIIDGSLEELNSSHLLLIGAYGLAYCYNLKSANFPNLTRIQVNGFEECVYLQSIELPIIARIDSYAFKNCFGLFNLELPYTCTSLGESVCEHIGYSFLYNGSAYNNTGFLRDSTFYIIKFPNVTTVNGGFIYGKFLNALVIGVQNQENICTLSSAFSQSTPIQQSRRGYLGYVYVPDSLVSDYKEATNWSTIADKIKPLSEFSETFVNDPSYIQDSWATIKQNINNDNYSQYLNKKKLLLVPGYGWCYMVCIKQDGDELADGTGNAKTTWFCEDCIGITRRMNPAMVSGTIGTGSIGGYANSEIKGVMDDIYEVLNAEDSELHNIITPVKKYTHVYNVDGTGSSTRNHDVESTEYVWLASYREMFSTSSTTYETKGVTYSDYFTNNASRIKYTYSGANDWWLRSSSSNGNYFRVVDSSGGSNFNDADDTNGIAFGFCI